MQLQGGPLEPGCIPERRPRLVLLWKPTCLNPDPLACEAELIMLSAGSWAVVETLLRSPLQSNCRDWFPTSLSLQQEYPEIERPYIKKVIVVALHLQDVLSSRKNTRQLHASASRACCDQPGLQAALQSGNKIRHKHGPKAIAAYDVQ